MEGKSMVKQKYREWSRFKVLIKNRPDYSASLFVNRKCKTVFDTFNSKTVGYDRFKIMIM